MTIAVISRICRHPNNKGHVPASLLRAAFWQIYKRCTGKSLDLKLFDHVLRCYPDSTSASSVLYFRGMPDWHEMSFMKAYLRPGDGFLDVGANVGVYTIFAAGLVGDGRLLALEPGQKQYERLVENIKLNNLANATALNIAAGDKNGKTKFCCAKDDSWDHIARDGETENIREVEIRRLDEITSTHNFALGKMDIEGAEPLAFEGAQKILRQRNPPVWIIELAGFSKMYGIRSDELLDRLKGKGYESALYDTESNDLLFTDRPWLHNRINVFLISSTSKDFVMNRLNATSKCL